MEMRLGRTLSPQELENKLRGFRPYLKDVGWSEAAQLGGVLFDISRVEYADFGALAQVALLVECAVRYGIEVRVALPLPRRRKGEKDHIESLGADIALQRRVARSIDARVQRRSEALRFAQNSGFIDSVRCAHVPSADGRVVILADFDRHDFREYVEPAARGEAPGLEPENVEPADLPRSVVPLQWLTPDVDTRDWEMRIRRILTLRGAGLAPGDAEAATTIVLRELIDNVRAHANEGEKSAYAPAALVGAIVFRRRTAMGTPVGDRAISEPYGEWIRNTGAAVVRIVVGDSGAGIHTTLREHVSATVGIDLPEFDRPLTMTEQTLIASLSPWSSRHRGSDSRKGGVRGLASVRRVVREANGALLLRCADTVSGMTYPEGARLPVSETRLAWIPGTLIDLSLAPAAWSPPTASLARGSVQVRGHTGLAVDAEGELQAASVLQTVARRPGPGMWILSGQVPDTPDATYGYCSDVLHLAEELSDENAIVLHAGQQTSTELVVASHMRCKSDERRLLVDHSTRRL